MAMIVSKTEAIFQQLEYGKKLEQYEFYDSLALDFQFTETGKTAFDIPTKKIYIGLKELSAKLDFSNPDLFEKQLYFIIAHEIGHRIQEEIKSQSKVELCNYFFNCSKASRELEADIIATQLFAHEYRVQKRVKNTAEFELMLKKLFKVQNEFRLCDYANYANDYMRMEVVKEVFRQSLLGHTIKVDGKTKRTIYNYAPGNQNNNEGSTEQVIRYKKNELGEIPPYVRYRDNQYYEKCDLSKIQTLLQARSMLHDGLSFNSTLKLVSTKVEKLSSGNKEYVRSTLIYQNTGKATIDFLFNTQLGCSSNDDAASFQYVDGNSFNYIIAPGTSITVNSTFYLPQGFDSLYIRRLIYPPMADSYYTILLHDSNQIASAYSDVLHFESADGSVMSEDNLDNWCKIFQALSLLINNHESIRMDLTADGVLENMHSEIALSVPTIRKASIMNSEKFSADFEILYLYGEGNPDNWLPQFNIGLQNGLTQCPVSLTKKLKVEANGITGEFEYKNKKYKQIWYFEKAGAEFLSKENINMFKLKVEQITR